MRRFVGGATKVIRWSSQQHNYKNSISAGMLTGSRTLVTFEEAKTMPKSYNVMSNDLVVTLAVLGDKVRMFNLFND